MSVEQSVEWVAGGTEVFEENRRSATLSTTNTTRSDLGLNPDHRDGKPATDRLSYGTAWPVAKRVREAALTFWRLNVF
jgi:hypothetical protein